METFAEKQMLYQVWATDTSTGKLVEVPFFPRAIRGACDKWVETMRTMIQEGKEKRYADPQCLPYLGMKPTLIGA